MSKETFYFSHDGNARNDEKLIAVRMRLGAEGYGIYFMIIERLLESSEYISVKDYNIIAFDIRVAAEKVKSIIEDFGLFDFCDDGKKFFSKSLTERMKPLDNLREQRRIAGKKSAEKRAQKTTEEQNTSNDATAVERSLTEKATKESKVEYSKEDNTIPNGIERGDKSPSRKKSFKSLSIEEVKTWLKTEMQQYLPNYGKDMLNNFYAYWTEKSDTGNGIRIQDPKHKYFDVGRRLSTWHSKESIKFSNNGTPTIQTKSKEIDELNAIEERQKRKYAG